MNDFDKRRSKGQALQDYLINYLDNHKISYFLTGYEGLTQKHNAKEKIIVNNSKTSLFVRHYPDLTLASSEDTFMIEVKNSSGIEKECYDAYKALYDELGVNIMFFLRDKKIYPFNNLKFNHIAEYDPVAEMNVPITDSVWKEPRKMDLVRYKQYKNAYAEKKKYTSGCSFAFIDFKNSNGFSIDNLLRIK